MDDMLIDWKASFGERTREDLAARNSGVGGDRTMPKRGVRLGGVQAQARVNHGRWIADCPFGCGGAEFVDFADLTFFCCGCRNAPVDAAPVPVKAPVKKRRDEIAALLLVRPVANRNWTPGEANADLAAENARKGIMP